MANNKKHRRKQSVVSLKELAVSLQNSEQQFPKVIYLPNYH